MSKEFTVLSAFDLTPLRTLAFTSRDDAETALSRAYGLSVQSQGLPKSQRILIFERLQRSLECESENLAQLISKEGGKPLRDSRVEAQRAVQGIRSAIASLYQWHGQEIPMGLSASSGQRLAFTRREPCGVVLAISAFNHPLNLIIHQVIPAIAVGCPVLLKPSLKTPLTCLRLIELLYEAGLPPEWCQVLLLDDETTGALSRDTRLSALSFIGSASVGWRLRAQLAPGVRCLLEHGGTAPVIICEDADLKAHIQSLVRGAYYHAGQVCVSVQNIFVHQSLYPHFQELWLTATLALKTGDPLDPSTDVGPMIRVQERDRVQSWVKEAIQAGARPLLLGQELGESCLSPIVLAEAPHTTRYFQEEIFGPAVGLYPFEHERDVLSLLHQSRFAFQASVITENINTALSLAERIPASTVLINDHTAFRVDWMPFGAYKHSGQGTGGILPSMQELSREKLMVVHYSEATI